jgi:hypothetical protein
MTCPCNSEPEPTPEAADDWSRRHAASSHHTEFRYTIEARQRAVRLDDGERL